MAHIVARAQVYTRCSPAPLALGGRLRLARLSLIGGLPVLIRAVVYGCRRDRGASRGTDLPPETCETVTKSISCSLVRTPLASICALLPNFKEPSRAHSLFQLLIFIHTFVQLSSNFFLTHLTNIANIIFAIDSCSVCPNKDFATKICSFVLQ